MPWREHRADTTRPSGVDTSLSRQELRRRAKEGVFIVATRGLAILLLGFGGNLVVARLLAPRDFGIVAIGMSFVIFTGMISDGGLGVGLIRRADPPRRDELGALSGLQLVLTGAATLLAVAVAGPFGRVGWVTAIMVASMPLVALQLPGRILLERALLYRRLAVVELSQVACYQLWAIGTVLAGFGVLGLATATVVRALVAAIAMAWACPEGLVRPRLSLATVKPLLAFGVRFQSVDATWLMRDQALNASVAATSGLSALGLWVLARRLMEVPYLIFQSLWRVSFPTMSRLLSEEEDVAPLVERAVSVSAVGTGFVLTGLAAGASGLVPGLFGERWQAASAIVPWACLGLAIGGCISVATQGYLYAIGDASSVLRSVILQTVVWFGVTLPLLPVVGVVALGMGWFASSVAEALVLGRATSRRIPVRLVRPLLGPVAVGLFSALIGRAVDVRMGSDLLSGVLGGGCAMALFAAGMAVSNRRQLRDAYRFATGSVRAALPRARRAAACPDGVTG
jgi:O-antigen/teichoic acid export membrane protein